VLLKFIVYFFFLSKTSLCSNLSSTPYYNFVEKYNGNLIPLYSILTEMPRVLVFGISIAISYFLYGDLSSGLVELERRRSDLIAAFSTKCLTVRVAFRLWNTLSETYEFFSSVLNECGNAKHIMHIYYAFQNSSVAYHLVGALEDILIFQ
jgi:hypothetical protein